MPSSTSQSALVAPRAKTDVVVRADQRVGRFGEEDGLVWHRLPGLRSVVTVVQADADDLVGARDRCAYPQIAERLNGSPFAAFVHDGTDAVEPPDPKNASSKSLTTSDKST